MKITVLKKGGKTVDRGRSTQDLPSLLQDETNIVWVDIDDWNDQVVKVLTETFHFHPLSIEHALETRHHPFIENYGDYISFTVHGVTKETDAHRFVTNELDGFLGSNFLVTYHDQQFRSISSLDAVIDSAPHTISRGADFLLHKILDQMIDAYIPVVEDFDDSIGGLEDDIFEAKDGNTEILEEVMRLKRSVGRLIRISTKQTSVLHRLASSEFTQISSEATPFLRDVCDHLQRIATLAESHRDLISSLMDVHLSVISNKTNDIMKLLAIFSAVMLPLSLIAGIYGMNIKSLPDDQHPDAFWHLMLVMAAIGIALMFYFWRKGWIKGFDRGKSAVAVRKSDSPDS